MDTRYFYRIFRYLLVAVTACGAAAWLLNTEPYSDDYVYQHEVTDAGFEAFWTSAGPEIEHFDQVLPSIVNHARFINGRLANFLMIALNLVPGWLIRLMGGLLIGCMLWLLMRVGRFGRDSVSLRWMAAAVALMWLALPWYNNFQSMDYQCNYVPTSILMMLTAMLSSRACSLGPWGIAGACATALLTGWMHEGFGTVLIAILGIQWLYAHGVERRRIAIIGVVAIVAVILAMSAGTMHRIGATVHFKIQTLWFIASRMVSQLWPFWLAVITLSIYAVRYRSRDNRSFYRNVFPWFAGASVGFIQAFVIQNIDRVLWPCELCSAVVVLQVMSRIIGKGNPGRGAGIVGFTAVAVYIAWFGCLVYWQRTVSAVQRSVQEQSGTLRYSGEKVVFGDLYLSHVPFVTLGIPTNQNYYEYYGRCVYGAARRVPGQLYLVLPERFRNVPPRQWDSIPGTAGLRGDWPMAVYFTLPGDTIACNDSTIYESRILRFTLGDPLPACTPIDRVTIMIKKFIGIDTDHLVRDTQFAAIDIDGRPAAVIFPEPFPRGYANREVLRIDTLDYK